MSARNYYTWQNRPAVKDSLWLVAARYFPQSQYSNTITLAEAIRLANPQILDWNGVPDGTLIFLPAIVTT